MQHDRGAKPCTGVRRTRREIAPFLMIGERYPLMQQVIQAVGDAPAFLKIEPRLLELQPLLASAVDQVAPIAKAKGLELTYKPTPK